MKSIVVAGDGARTDVRLLADFRVAQIGEVHRLCAFADGALFELDEVADAHVSLQMTLGTQARERADDYAIVEAALRRDAMRLDRHVIA